MLSESIIVAIITSAVTALGSSLGFIVSVKAEKSKKEDRQAQELHAMEQRMKDYYAADREVYLSKIKGIENEIEQMKEIRQELKTEFEKHEIKINMRLDELEKKQDKHNQIIERTYKLEEQTAVQAEQIKDIRGKIDDLK